MAEAVIWSSQALEDIGSIAEYISRDSVYHASQVVDLILAAGESLSIQAKRGRIVPELGDPRIRECFVYSYRVIYEVSGDTVFIIAVIHGKQLLERDERFT